MNLLTESKEGEVVSISYVLQPVVNPLALPKAVAFVDYEHWLISLDKIFHLKPNIKEWIDSLHTKVNLCDLYFFGDFSSASMEPELFRIRSYTNKIIETKNAGYYKKDFTDFIMLDAIYQQIIMSPDTDAFILFTGDAHFNSVAAFLKNIRKKKVGLYGVRGALSTQLKNTVDWWEEVPSDLERFRQYYVMIFNNLRHLEQRNGGFSKPTFVRTVEATAEYNNVDKDDIKAALEQLMAAGYIYQSEEYLGLHKRITVLRVDWEAAERDGVCETVAKPLPVVTARND